MTQTIVQSSKKKDIASKSQKWAKFRPASQTFLPLDFGEKFHCLNFWTKFMFENFGTTFMSWSVMHQHKKIELWNVRQNRKPKMFQETWNPTQIKNKKGNAGEPKWGIQIRKYKWRMQPWTRQRSQSRPVEYSESAKLKLNQAEFDQPQGGGSWSALKHLWGRGPKIRSKMAAFQAFQHLQHWSALTRHY